MELNNRLWGCFGAGKRGGARGLARRAPHLILCGGLRGEAFYQRPRRRGGGGARPPAGICLSMLHRYFFALLSDAVAPRHSHISESAAASAAQLPQAGRPASVALGAAGADLHSAGPPVAFAPSLAPRVASHSTLRGGRQGAHRRELRTKRELTKGSTASVRFRVPWKEYFPEEREA